MNELLYNKKTRGTNDTVFIILDVHGADVAGIFIIFKKKRQLYSSA